MTDLAIQVEGLTKRYGERVLLEHVSWHVKKRDRIGLSGPNGAGKTTLLRMLAGFEEPDEGSIRMASDTTIGYLPQDGLVHAGRTVHEECVQAFAERLALKDEQHRIEPKDRTQRRWPRQARARPVAVEVHGAILSPVCASWHAPSDRGCQEVQRLHTLRALLPASPCCAACRQRVQDVASQDLPRKAILRRRPWTSPGC